MGRAHLLGTEGERLAAETLVADGWRICHRNYRYCHKELDIVARRGGVVAFVEVKTRSGRDFGDALEAVTAAKRRELLTAARAWIARHGRPGDTYRFDAIAVDWPHGRPPRVRHVPDAWRP